MQMKRSGWQPSRSMTWGMAAAMLPLGLGEVRADDAGALPAKDGACLVASTHAVWRKTPGRVFGLRMVANEKEASLSWGVSYSAHSNPPEARLVASLTRPLAATIDARVVVRLPFGWPPWLVSFAVPVPLGGGLSLVKWNPVMPDEKKGEMEWRKLFILLETDKKTRFKVEAHDEIHSITVGEVTLVGIHAAGDGGRAFVLVTAQDNTALAVSDDKNKQPDFALWTTVFGKAPAKIRKVGRGRGLALVMTKDGPVMAFDDVGRRRLARLDAEGQIVGATVDITRGRAESFSLAVRGDHLVLSWIERPKKKPGQLKVGTVARDMEGLAASAVTISAAEQDVRGAVVVASAGQPWVAWNSREKRRDQIRVATLECKLAAR